MPTEMPSPSFIPYESTPFDEVNGRRAVLGLLKHLKGRRSIRQFSSEAVPLGLIKHAIAVAHTAPSGANKQPWSFCVVGNPEVKRLIRERAEEEERENYAGRMSDRWLHDLAHLGTDAHKPFLEEAPYLIAVFKKPYEIRDEKKMPNYYVNESVGIAVGMLLTALRLAGLATLTHTPSPMNFLAEVLGRPANERAYLLIPVGVPHPDAIVPNLAKTPVEEVVCEYL